MPGVYNGRSIEPRNLFASGVPAYFPNVLKAVDGSKSRDTTNSDSVSLLRAGLVLGKITSGGKYAPSILGVTGVLHDTSAVTTVLTLPATTVTEISRRLGASGTLKLIGPPTAAGTVATETVTYSAIATSTTLTITATTADFAAGSIVAPVDGSEAPSQFVTDQYGLDVLDINGTAIDHPIDLLKSADINTDYIVNYSSLDASVKTWLKAAFRTNNPGAVLTFSDDR
jgi:hypothetical protein